MSSGTIDDKVEDLDTFFKGLREEDRHKKVEDAFEAIKKFTDEKNQNNLYNKVLTPAFDEFYKTFVEELDKEFGGDDKELYDKKKELRRITVEALKKFFEKAKPSVVHAYEELKGDDLYDALTRAFSELHGYDENIIDKMIKEYHERGGEDAKTVGELKRNLDVQRITSKGEILKALGKKYATAHLAHFDRETVLEHGKEKVEDEGYTISNKGKFFTLDPFEIYHAVMHGIPSGKWGIDKDNNPLNPKHYGLKYGKKTAGGHHH